MKTSYIFASRSRPDKFIAALNNIEAMSAKDDYEIICSLDSDDASMGSLTVAAEIISRGKVRAFYGESSSKIHAINREVGKISPDTSIIICMSDDMQFIQPGFDDIIRTDMQKYFPDLDGVLHYPCGTPVQDKVITLSIMGITYFRRFNYIYNPEYTSLWADMEFGEVAKMLGKYKYLPHIKIFNHNHPVWTHETYDALMTRNEGYYHSDKEIYFKRMAKNFDL